MALLLFVVLSLVAAAAIYVVYSGAYVPPAPNRPTILFSSVEGSASIATFSITSASMAVEPRNYLVNLNVNGVSGTAVPLSTGFSVALDSSAYSIQWLDADSNNLVSVGDRFAIMPPYLYSFPYDSALVFYLLWSDGSYIQSASWQTPPYTNKPQMTFSGVTVGSGGTVATFVVADASQAVSYSNYKFNLKVNGTFGSARALGASGTGVTITVSNVTCTVTYTDVGADGTVNGGDQFGVSGLRPSTQYQFVLLWSDGSQVQYRDWVTP